MTAKEYLQQAYWLDKRINAKIRQKEMLLAIAQKVTPSMSFAPGKGKGRDMAEIIARITDLENSINDDIDRLVDIKTDIRDCIAGVRDPRLQILLEMRYLCHESWRTIAGVLGYEEAQIYRLHGKALQMVKHDSK